MEIWKNIPDYEGYYQASNLGNIRTIERVTSFGNQKLTVRPIIKKQTKNKKGYLSTVLSKNNIKKTKEVHRLVMKAFFGESDLVVDHINGIRSDNRIENLRYVTQRQNASFITNKRNKNSKYVGVRKEINSCGRTRWRSQIRINQQIKNIGTFNCETAAMIAYQKTIIQLGF